MKKFHFGLAALAMIAASMAACEEDPVKFSDDDDEDPTTNGATVGNGAQTSGAGGSTTASGAGGSGGSGGQTSCGDGQVDPEIGETCDPPSSCPTDCNDVEACTTDTMSGSAQTCDVVCSNTPVTICEISGDGCCPSNCSGLNDLDCAVCGNFSVDVGETCDGNCPTSCDDFVACTMDTQTGTPGNCDVVCSNTTINSCTNNDGCCPNNCTQFNDTDCACTTGNITTSFTTNNGSNGNMFDIQALKAIEIFSFDANLDTGSHTMEVWWRPGSHVGFEGSMTGWTLAGTTTVTSNGMDTSTPVPINVNVQIPSGQTYAFYVTTQGTSINYITGTQLGSVYVANTDLQVREGVGKSYPFSTTYTPRVFSGTVHYERCGP